MGQNGKAQGDLGNHLPERRYGKHFLPPHPGSFMRFRFWSHLGSGNEYMLLGGGTFWLTSVRVAGNRPRALHLRGKHFNITPTSLWFSETGPCYPTQVGLKLGILLPLPPRCWHSKCTLSHLVIQFLILGFSCLDPHQLVENSDKRMSVPRGLGSFLN